MKNALLLQSDACSSSVAADPEGNHSVPSTVFLGSECLKSCGRKRVRRIQVELPHYRKQVQELELKLKRLKLHKTSPPTNNNAKIISLPQSHVGSVWNDIAERQLKARVRSEQQNTELKTLYKELTQFSIELEKLLQKSETSRQELVGRVSDNLQLCYTELTAGVDDKIFSEQLAMAARLYLELQQRYSWHQGTISRSIQFGWDLSLGKEVVKLDSHTKAGISFESRSGTALPFKLDVVVKAFWKFFGHRDGDKDCISYNDFSTDSLARSFALKTDFGGVSSKLLGKYTCRKFITEDEVTLVWIECADVENFGGVTFSGMQYLKRGYLRLRKIHQEGPGQQSTSTIAETFTETTPIFREGADNLAIQTQDLISVVKRSYNEVNAVFCQTMNNLLLEEDWKIEIQKDTPA